METDRLRQFKTVVEAGGVLRASELIGISGGGLSKSMKALEQELGYRLFHQKGRGLELTEAGQSLYDQLPQFQKSLENLFNLETQAEDSEPPLRFVSFEVFTTYFLASLVSESFADIKIDVREAIPGEMEELISEGHSDVGLTYLPIPRAGIEFLKVGRVRMGIYGLKGKWNKADVKDIPFVIPIAPLAGSPSGVRGLDGWPEHLFERNVKYRVGMMESAIQMCHKGLAVAFLPRFVAEMVNRNTLSKSHLEEVPMPVGVTPVSRDVFVIERQGTEETKKVRLVAKAVRKLS